MKKEQHTDSFFHSSLVTDNQFQPFEDFEKWFARHCKPEEFLVEEVPLDKMDKWQFDEGRNRLFHESGRFFSVEGIHTVTNFNGGMEWDQPIINQPEIGFLGFITKVFNGVRYFLMQAKMEPGNINTLQISPSLQATKSNFTQVHKGKRPTYLEYFNGEKKVKILSDQLQTEQGARFFRKRNRNIIIEVEEDIPVEDDFCWLTLGELKQLIRRDNVLNMDTRSVLSTVPLIDDSVASRIAHDLTPVLDERISNLGLRYINSYITENSVHSTDEIISWYNQQKVNYEMEVTRKPLSQLEGWTIGEMTISNSDRYFNVIGVNVKAGTREVRSWMQPLLKDKNVGLLAFITTEINGVIHFLVQAKVEPGNLDIIELAPSVSCSNYEHVKERANRPFLFDEVFDNRNTVHYDALQSEEGGRFFQIQNRNMIVESDHVNTKDIPSNFIWMTLRQMKEFMRYGMFSMEARSLISTIDFVSA